MKIEDSLFRNRTNKRVKTMKRYYIDHRIGVIAVRDHHVMCGSPGLYPSLPGVIYCWHGKMYQDEWAVPQWKVKAARILCWVLNFLDNCILNNLKKGIKIFNVKAWSLNLKPKLERKQDD